MIFVVLAIIILVVSFAVALVSLIREQKGLAQRPREEPESNLASGQIKFPQETETVGKTTANEGQKAAESFKEKSQDRKPFFWEEKETPAAKEESTQGADLQSLWEDKPQETNQVQPTSRLSGEVSLKDIAGNSDN